MSLSAHSPAGAADQSKLIELNDQLKELFDLSADERESWFTKNTIISPEKKGRLRELLNAENGSTSAFLSKPVILDNVVNELDQILDDQEGDLIGSYRLIRKIGAGGMGTVWLAERDDGTLKRRVALKLPSVSWSRDLFARTRRERDILGSLEHPAIARLYDGGVTAQGRPYLVMEFIDGHAIDVYCDDNALDIRARLRLFLQVCDAFAYAHSRLVVHGDPKPSNVLVTANGAVHLLDFGVAKLLSVEVEAAEDALVAATARGETARMTRTPGRAHTPDYASPEQIHGQSIGVASDVYSLGVVLFELLVGKRPYRLRRTTDAALEEAVLQGNLPLASTLAPRERVASLRGDLNAILAKATARNTKQRYISVEAFAADIQRYLANEPVQARSVGRWYRLIKFVRRHFVAITATACVAGSLVAAVGISTWHWREAQRQQANALLQLENSESVLEFVDTVLTNGLRLDEKISLSQLLERVERIAERFTGENEQVRLAAVDRISSWYASYGAHEKVIALIDGVDKRDIAVSRSNVYGTLECRRAFAWAALGQYGRAVEVLDRAINEYAADATAFTNCLNTRGRVAREVNDADTALAMARKTLEVFDASGQRSATTRAVFMNDLARAYAMHGEMDRSDELFDQSTVTLSKLGRGTGPEAMSTYASWGATLAAAGNPLRAIDKLDQARAIARENTPIGREPYGITLNIVAALMQLGRYVDATSEIDRLLENPPSQSGSLPFAFVQIAKARLLIRNGMAADAGRLLDEAELSVEAKSLPIASPVRLRLLLARGEWHAAIGAFDQSIAAFSAAITASEAASQGSVVPSALLIARSEIYAKKADWDAAQRDAERALITARISQGSMKYSVFVGHALLSLAAVQQATTSREFAAATASLAILHLQATLDPHDPLIARARAIIDSA
jgi:eukaryotic-like serine/threonine-protein kinase